MYKQKRLSFLRRFLNALMISIQDIPSSIINPMSLRMNFHVDDLRLSIARRIINYYGYELDIRIIPRGARRQRNCSRFYDSRKNLAFLRDCIKWSGLSQAQFAAELNLSRDALAYWFKTDDIRLSRIYHIAYHINANILFIIYRVDAHFDSTEPIVSDSIFLNEAQPISLNLLRHDSKIQ